MAVVENADINLHMLLTRWHSGFAFSEQTALGWRESLQFFDQTGVAMHKIYLTEESNIDHFYDLIDDYAAADQTPSLIVSDHPPIAPERLDSSIDIISFRTGWDAMQGINDFVALQFRYHINRLQALRMPGGHHQSACDL